MAFETAALGQVEHDPMTPTFRDRGLVPRFGTTFHSTPSPGSYCGRTTAGAYFERLFLSGGKMNSASYIKYGFTALGILLLLVTLYLVQQTRTFYREASRANGTVIELVREKSSDSITYAPVVRFVTDADESVEFTSGTSSNPPSYTEGESVEVLYRTAEPHDARINGFFSLWLGPIITGGLGTIFTLIGGVLLLVPMLGARKQADLRQSGTCIVTTFQSVGQNMNLTVNGRHPFRVFTQWTNPATSQIHVFESENLWFDPAPYINTRDIAVFIERNNPKRYFVDLSFLPRLAQ